MISFLVFDACSPYSSFLTNLNSQVWITQNISFQNQMISSHTLNCEFSFVHTNDNSQFSFFLNIFCQLNYNRTDIQPFSIYVTPPHSKQRKKNIVPIQLIYHDTTTDDLELTDPCQTPRHSTKPSTQEQLIPTLLLTSYLVEERGLYISWSILIHSK